MVRFHDLPFWYNGSNQPLTMVRYRIVRRPSRVHIGEYVYDVQRFRWPFTWKDVNVYLTIEEAKAFVDDCKKSEAKPRVKREVVYTSEP